MGLSMSHTDKDLPEELRGSRESRLQRGLSNRRAVLRPRWNGHDRTVSRDGLREVTTSVTDSGDDALAPLTDQHRHSGRWDVI